MRELISRSVRATLVDGDLGPILSMCLVEENEDATIITPADMTMVRDDAEAAAAVRGFAEHHGVEL